MKVILTENQVNTLKQRISEFTQQEINQIFVIGNIVTFFVKTGEDIHAIKLQVINNPFTKNTGNEIANIFFMKIISDFPIDVKGSTFIINHPNQDIRSGSFTVGNLGKETNSGYQFPKPKNYTFKNIFKVEVRDSSNKLVNTYYSKEHANNSEEPIEKQSEIVTSLKETMDSLSSGDILQLVLKNKNTIPLKFIDKKGDIIQFELNNQTDDLPNGFKDKQFSSVEIDEKTLKSDNINVSIPIKFFWSENGEMKNNVAVINVVDWEISESGDEEEYEIANNTELAKEMMQVILNDPLMKQAFYSQPTMWNLITSAIKGKNPRGTGIAPALEIIEKYKTDKILKKIGENAEYFKFGKAASFKFLEKGVDMNPTGQVKDKLTLPITNTFRATVQQYKLNSDNLVLASSQPKFKLIINEELKDVENGFEVTVIKEIKTSTGIQQYKKNAKVVFISLKGSGYFKEPKNNTTKVN